MNEHGFYVRHSGGDEISNFQFDDDIGALNRLIVIGTNGRNYPHRTVFVPANGESDHIKNLLRGTVWKVCANGH